MTSFSSSKRRQQEFVQKLPMIEKLAIAPKLISSLAHVFGSLFTAMLRGKESKPPEFYKYLHYTLMRTTARLMSPGQLQVISPPTDDAYEAACKKHGVAPDSLVLEDGTRAHWIGSSSAEKVIINFHGGGYVLPAGASWFEFMFQIHALLSAQEQKSVSILFLSYDLAPAARYPRQLQQAAALLSHVLHVLHKSPQNLILTGDSAGANLVLALMSHLSHPHPSRDVPIIPITMETNLRGIVLISPWVDFRLDAKSFSENATKDCISLPGGQKWADGFMGYSRPFPNVDNYNQAASAPLEWWEGLKVDDILVVAGKDEVLVDTITEWVEKMEQVKSLQGKITVFVTEGEAHDQPNLDIEMGYKTDGEQARRVKSFLNSRL